MSARSGLSPSRCASARAVKAADRAPSSFACLDTVTTSSSTPWASSMHPLSMSARASDCSASASRSPSPMRRAMSTASLALFNAVALRGGCDAASRAVPLLPPSPGWASASCAAHARLQLVSRCRASASPPRSSALLQSSLASCARVRARSGSSIARWMEAMRESASARPRLYPASFSTSAASSAASKAAWWCPLVKWTSEISSRAAAAALASPASSKSSFASRAPLTSRLNSPVARCTWHPASSASAPHLTLPSSWKSARASSAARSACSGFPCSMLKCTRAYWTRASPIWSPNCPYNSLASRSAWAAQSCCWFTRCSRATTNSRSA
mmetsp:Transcript_96505/g.306117  ORF Transcript_96505/g.306117 Transcript_96505/m.306117 type:complete len:328 (+) Transcript_96505:586-1569(+)